MAFGRLQLEPMLQEPAKDNLQAMEVLFLSMGEDYHIIQVDQGIRQVKLSEAVLHESLKRRWSITEPVRHSQKLIHSHTTHHKGCVLLGVLGHLDLPETRFQVHGGEEPGTYHGLHGLLHWGKGVCIFLGPAVQLAEIDTEPETPILFAHQNHCITPQGLGRPDGASVQHFL